MVGTEETATTVSSWVFRIHLETVQKTWTQVAVWWILISVGKVMASSSSALRSLRALGVPCTWVPVTQWYPKILAIRTANYWSSVSFLTVSEVFDGFRQREDGFGWFLSAFDCF